MSQKIVPIIVKKSSSCPGLEWITSVIATLILMDAPYDFIEALWEEAQKNYPTS